MFAAAEVSALYLSLKFLCSDMASMVQGLAPCVIIAVACCQVRCKSTSCPADMLCCDEPAEVLLLLHYNHHWLMLFKKTDISSLQAKATVT